MIVPLDVTIRPEEVLHFLGYPETRAHRPPPRMRGLLDRTLRAGRSLARPRGVFVSLHASEAPSVGLESLQSDGLVIGLVTIGEALEKRSDELLREGAVTESLFLDAAGSAAAEEAADRLGAIVTGSESRDGRHVSCRVSPGYGSWPLTAQRLLFERLPDAGVTLLPSMLMVPRKSISFAMWLGASAALSGCAVCSLDRCVFRRS